MIYDVSRRTAVFNIISPTEKMGVIKDLLHTSYINHSPCVTSRLLHLTWSIKKLHVALIHLLALLLLFLQVMRHFPQLPDEFGQRLLVMLPSRQQLAAETGEVLFDLF